MHFEGRYLDIAFGARLELVSGDDEGDDPPCHGVEAVDEETHIRRLLWLLGPHLLLKLRGLGEKGLRALDEKIRTRSLTS